MLTPSEKLQIANIRIQIEQVRREITGLRAKKKSTIEYYSKLIKSTKDSKSKANYRLQKQAAIRRLNDQIEQKKVIIEQKRNHIAQLRK